MSKEGDHHYVPQFHLRNWADSEGLVNRWGRIAHNGKLVQKRVSPAATGYVPGLYALEHVPSDKIHLIEEKVFGVVDRKAASILEKLTSQGVRSLSKVDRQWWAIYLNATLLPRSSCCRRHLRGHRGFAAKSTLGAGRRFRCGQRKCP
ncbi:DUF4238 domain-containing protein [Mesorhizobium australicum]|uniref:DUF4238 domain-containing protein n=1 Tax=Mesorhizobium australicum TaxID=536018 RepID=UPI003338F214